MRNNKRIASNPIIVKEGMKPCVLKKVSVTEKLFQEAWLQNLIFENPSLLPTADIESVFSPLISIGREIPTEVGPIDNMFISPEGYLTIVETKLWRNPEARREVVGQIVDYAKEVNKWSYDDLDKKVRKFFQTTQSRDLGIIDIMREHYSIEDEEESALIDAIIKNIQQGHFLLLIVGDGIRESVEDMAEYLSRTPQLHFTLALIELKIFEMDEGRLVLPQIVMRTQEVTRAIIRIEGGNIEKLSVDMDFGIDKNNKIKERFTITEDQYYSELSRNISGAGVEFARGMMEDMQDLGCEIQLKKSSIAIKYPVPLNHSKMFTLLVVTKKGETYSGNLFEWLHNQLETSGYPVEIGDQFTNQLNGMLKDCEIDPSKPEIWNLEKIMPKYDSILVLVGKFIEDIDAIKI